MMVMKKIFYTLLILWPSMFVPLSAQTKYQSAEQDVKIWKDEAFREKGELELKKCRKKKITYHADKYIVEAFFDRNNIVEGKTISFMNMRKETFLSGVLISSDGYLMIEGIKFGSDHTRAYGTFEIANTPDGTFSFKPSKGKTLIVRPKKLEYVTGDDYGVPVILSFRSKCIYSKNTNYDGYESLAAPVNVSDFSIEDVQLRNFLLGLSDKVEIVWPDRTFIGSVKPVGKESNPVAFFCLYGVTQYDDGKTMMLKSSNGKLVLSVNYNGFADEKQDRQYAIPAKYLELNDWWNENAYIHAGEVFRQEQLKREQEQRRREQEQQKRLEESSARERIGSSHNQRKEEDEISVWAWIFIFLPFIAFVWYLIKAKLDESKCPHCKQRFALKVVNKRDLGYAKRTHPKEGGFVNWHRYRYTYECQYCGKRCTEEKVESLG